MAAGRSDIAAKPASEVATGKARWATAGEGTGPLSGIHGQGTFWFTGPTSLQDIINYVYGR